MTALDALQQLHRDLYPERYGSVAMTEADLDPDTTDFIEWDSGTIEWVAEDIERALVAEGVTVPPAVTNWRDAELLT